jgi:hypothetical protein
MNITSAVDAIIHAVLPVSICTLGKGERGSAAALHKPPERKVTARAANQPIQTDGWGGKALFVDNWIDFPGLNVIKNVPPYCGHPEPKCGRVNM